MGAQVTEGTTFAVAQQISQAPIERQGKSRLIGLLGVLVGMRLPTVDLMKALERDHMIEEIWKESSFAEAAAEIMRPELEAKIKAELGSQIKAEGMREIAQTALEDRFGALSEDVLEALSRADEATLKKLIVLKALEDVRALLGLK